MVAHPDFIVAYDPEKDTMEDVTKRVIYSLFVRRIKQRKPCVIFISGDSGEGKSYAALKLQELILDVQGFNQIDVLEATNIFTPLEYAQKLDYLLKGSPRKLNVMIVHEARELVKAKNWHSFINQTVSDINAMSRTLKRLITIIVSQFIRDISTDVRYTINFYIKTFRPRGQPARIEIYKLWKDDYDLESPKLRRRKVRGFLRLPSGKYKRFMPDNFQFSKPSPEVIELFEARDYESKAHIIRGKLNKLIKEMSKELKVETGKVDAIADFYTKLHPEQLNQLGRQMKRGFKLNKNVKQMHDLTKEETEQLTVKIQEGIKKLNLIGGEDETQESTLSNVQEEKNT